jgi:thiamine pyrophosphokinase
MSPQRIIIFTGGTLGAWALEDLRPDDVFIGADRGALFLVQHGLTPAIALGDFDSINNVELELIRQSSRELLACDPVMKDLTDTEMAFNWALNQKPEEIIIYGALGTRLDHSLANIHLLRKALELLIKCTIIDAHNRIRLTDHYLQLEKSARFSYVSLLPLSLEVKGITLEGFQYPLHNATLQLGQSLGISNIIAAPLGHIHLNEGLLLVIESKD